VHCTKNYDNGEIPYQELQETFIFPYTCGCLWSFHSSEFAPACLLLCGKLAPTPTQSFAYCLSSEGLGEQIEKTGARYLRYQKQKTGNQLSDFWNWFYL